MAVEIASSLHLLSDADDHEENLGPSASKKLKTSAKAVGTAKYRTKFHQEWSKLYPFVQEVKDNPFNCLETALHQANVKQMKGQTTLGFHPESSPISEQVIRAEVKVAHNAQRAFAI
ncbi:hypothetical protein EMCRGX_G011135 [Ephydatia muelleri]